MTGIISMATDYTNSVQLSYGGVEQKGSTTSAPLGRMLRGEYPEIAASTRLLQLFRDDKTLFQLNEGNNTSKSFYEKDGLLADSNFFQLIRYSFKEGNPETALQAPNSVVISEGLAKKMFGTGHALDKVVRIGSNTNGDSLFRITGVFSEPSAPSHINANFFMSFRGGNMNRFANDSPSLVNNNMFHTYLLLKEGTDEKKLVQKFPSFVQRHLSEQLRQMGKQRNYFLTPVADIHLSNVGKGLSPAGNTTTLFILSSIAILTLLIACINFMNLSTANSAKRAAEVGVRKVLGAQRSLLLRQFLGESLVMAVIALIFALVLTFALLPLFEQVSGKTLLISFQQKILLCGLFILLALITGLLAGSYPAFLSFFF